MLLDQPEAPPRSDRRVLAFAVGCLLLAAAPAILSAFDEAIDRSLHLSDVWPDFWALLAQMEAWWIGGVVLGAAFIGGRVVAAVGGGAIFSTRCHFDLSDQSPTGQ